MIPSRLTRSLGGSDPGGVFYLHGPNEFEKGEVASALAEAHLDAGPRDFNFDVLRGPETDLETLASILATPPMMAEWRVVLVKEAEALASHPRARKLLVELARKPPPGLALILVATKPDRSKAAFYREMEKAARSMAFPVPDDAEIPGWLMEMARERHGLELVEDAARALAAAVGAEPGILVQELDKLASFVGPGGGITAAAVEAAGIRLPRQDRWKWLDLVAEKRFSEALEGLRVLLAQGDTGVGLTIALGTQFLRMGLAREKGRAALEAELPPYQKFLGRRVASQCARWTPEELEKAVLGLRRVDQLLKAATFSAEHVLETWLLERWAEDRREGTA